MQLLCLILALLRALSAASEALDCASASRTVQLDGTQVARTWQPDGDCPWLESRWSVTDRSPAAVRSGPRWLVMQLRRPMLVERVSVQSWGGGWQTAGAVGSRVSAFGAASLPLELQLQDPCRASWDALGGWGGWRRVGDGGDGEQTPVVFILLNSTEQLDFDSLSLSGRRPQMKLRVLSKGFGWHRGLLFYKGSAELKFSITSCASKKLECWLTNGIIIINAEQMGDAYNDSSGSHNQMFKVKLDGSEHGKLLRCRFHSAMAPLIEQMLTTVVSPVNLRIEVSPVLVAGHQATVRFSSQSYPEPLHHCWLSSTQATRNLTLVSQAKSAGMLTGSRDLDNRVVVQQLSEFRLDVTSSLIENKISCSADGINMTPDVINHVITAVSAPCVTDVDLGSSPHWLEGEVRLIRVASRNCSIWAATHTCWLVKSNRTHSLAKLNETDFTSFHQLPVTRRMGQRDWFVRCRVNQSGVAHDDVETRRSSQPDVLYRAVMNLSAHEFNGSHLSVNVTSSDSRPPVSNISCSSSIITPRVQDPRVMVLACNSSNWWRFNAEFDATDSSSLVFNITCVAKQIHDGTFVFVSNGSFSAYGTRNSQMKTCYRNDSGQKKSHMEMVARALTAVLLLCVALATAAVAIAIIRCHHQTQGKSVRSRGIRSSSSATQDLTMPQTDSPAVDSVSLRACGDNDKSGQPLFVTVLRVTSAHGDASDEEFAYDLAAGHYEPDGCTFVSYSDGQFPNFISFHP